jgi:hypothetical protein
VTVEFGWNNDVAMVSTESKWDGVPESRTSVLPARTYLSGDVVLVSALDSQDRRPMRGDVALLLYPLDPARLMIDRVIGTEGDTVQTFDGYVYVRRSTG